MTQEGRKPPVDNRALAQALLDAVGADNVTDAYNCMTRLRLTVRTVTVTKEQLKALPGVKGVLFPGEGQIHIVLGPGKAAAVTTIFNELREAAGKAAGNAAEPEAEPAATTEKAAAAAAAAPSATPEKAPQSQSQSQSVADLARQASVGDGKELHAAMQNPVANGVNLIGGVDNTFDRVHQNGENRLDGFRVGGHGDVLHNLLVADLVGQTAVDVDALAQALGRDHAGLGIHELVLQAGRAGIDDQNIHAGVAS